METEELLNIIREQAKLIEQYAAQVERLLAVCDGWRKLTEKTEEAK